MRNAAWTVAVGLLLAGNGGADVWDDQTVNDDTPASVNELVRPGPRPGRRDGAGGG